MAKHKAIIRKLPAVETLGSATYICSDKTGTLTQNKMTVTSIISASSPKQSIDHKPSSTNMQTDFILTLACLCNNSTETNTQSSSFTTLTGEPTENALVYAAINNFIYKEELDKRYPRLYEIPFDSRRKLMTTIHSLGQNTYRYITKGAPDILINRCTHYYDGQTIQPMDKRTRNNILYNNKHMASKALRVIAVAYKDVLNTPPKTPTITDHEIAAIEDNLCIVGLIGMIDPPRKETYEAVKRCRLAGVTPVMITGDHPLTAYAIAKDIGICRHEEEIITGTELDKLSDDKLKEQVRNYKVFARVSPTHKVKIVKALRENNEVVAMTGDGVNDAPALKAADIGASMGLSGTDVAKDASDMILSDDNFATIVKAIKQGRGIYENIRKSIHFLLSCNIGEIISILFAILFSLPTPLLAVQLLWINLVTDSLPAISLGCEPISDRVMNNRHTKTNSFFTKNLVFKIIVEGFMIGLLTLLAFITGINYSLATGRTMAFAVLGLSQLFHSFNMKTDTSLINYPIFNNLKLIISFIICVILQVSVISIPFLADIFKVVDLNILQWLIVVILSFLPIPLVELQKLANHRRNNNLYS